jgi:hypothetical protein
MCVIAGSCGNTGKIVANELLSRGQVTYSLSPVS